MGAWIGVSVDIGTELGARLLVLNILPSRNAQDC